MSFVKPFAGCASLLLGISCAVPALLAQTGSGCDCTFSVESQGTGQGGAPNQILQAYDGNYYGSTPAGGTYGAGSVFRLTPQGTFTTLYSFNGADNTQPYSGEQLTIGPDGALYGVGFEGGADGYGVVFKLTLAGVYTELYSFTGLSDGAAPIEPLVLGTDGNFYGATTLSDCTSMSCLGGGSVFRITPAGKFTSLKDLSNSDDGYSATGLIQASDGNFYGIAEQGGQDGKGVIFKLTTAGAYALFYNFTGSQTDQDKPIAPLTQGPDGLLYGTTFGNEDTFFGSVYSISTGGAFHLLKSFASGSAQGGGFGYSPIVAGSDGNLYVVSSGGGNGGGQYGTIFRLSTAGSLQLLYSFEGGDDGDSPAWAVQGSDGNLYGAASSGGKNGEGTVFKIGFSPALAAPVQLTLSSSQVTPGTAVTLNWKVLNAFSDTAQQCYAFVQNSAAGAGTWTGKQAGALSDGIYSGSAKFTPMAAGTYTYALTCGGVESGFATLTVTSSSKTATSTTLTGLPNPAYIGQVVTLTATVKKSSGTGAPTGKVTFSIPGLTIGSAELNGSGVATLAASSAGQPAGTYPVTATYAGDSDDEASTSSPVAVTLKAAAATTTRLSANPNPVTRPANCTLTATVTSSSGTPGGSVTFSVEGEAIGTANLNGSGVATLTAGSGSVSAGTYPVVGQYNGAAAFAKSSSPAVNVTVK